MKIYCRVTPAGLVPLYDDDYEERKKLKIGADVLCQITTPRNIKFHRKFFALISLTFENLPHTLQEDKNIYNKDVLLERIKYDLGLYDEVKHGDFCHIILRSISFAAMDNNEFENFYNRTVDLILYDYLPGTDRKELLEEIERQFKSKP